MDRKLQTDQLIRNRNSWSEIASELYEYEENCGDLLLDNYQNVAQKFQSIVTFLSFYRCYFPNQPYLQHILAFTLVLLKAIIYLILG